MYKALRYNIGLLYSPEQIPIATGRLSAFRHLDDLREVIHALATHPMTTFLPLLNIITR